MKKSRFTESQIVGILKQQEQGARVVRALDWVHQARDGPRKLRLEDECREHGVEPGFIQPGRPTQNAVSAA